MLLTLPGIPGIYTGEEVGAAYEPYKDAHQIAWDDAYGLQHWYKRLIALRQEHPALRSREIRMLDVADGQNVLAYLRGAGAPSDNVLVLLNYGISPAQMSIPRDIIEKLSGGSLSDLLTGEEIGIDGNIRLDGETARILKPL